MSQEIDIQIWIGEPFGNALFVYRIAVQHTHCAGELMPRAKNSTPTRNANRAFGNWY